VPAQHQAPGGHRDERGDRHAVGQGGPVQAEVCGCHPGDHDRNAEPEEGDDEDGGDEPGALPGSGQRDQGAVDAQQRQPKPRVVHDDIQPPEPLMRLPDRGERRLPVGDIQLDREDRVTVLRDQVVQRAEVPGRRRDLVAAVQGRDRPLTAEAAACHR
jgi:hypothetical protein